MNKKAYHIVITVCIVLVMFSMTPYIISTFNKDFDYGQTKMGQLDLYLNKQIYFDIITWSLINVIFIMLGIYLYKYNRWSPYKLSIYAITYLILSFVLLLPVMSIMNIVLMIGCRNKPIYSMEDKQKLFPISSTIEANHAIIKREFLDYKGTKECTHKQTVAFRIGTGEINGACWRMVILKQAGVLKDVAKQFPTTMSLIQHPSIHNAVFSILDANVNIPAHIGYYKGYLRYHLGVEIPEENGNRPFIVVGDNKYYWKEGEGVLFDDMFYHHVKNPTNKRRTVLYIDVIRPLNQPLDTLNRGMIKLIENNPFIKYVISEQHKQVVNIS